MQTFYCAKVGPFRLAVASPTCMGRVHAAVTTVDLIRHFSPRYVMVVGIAGGNPSTVALGDVIESNQIIDYELQKMTSVGREIRSQAYQVSQRLLSSAKSLQGWENAVRVGRPRESPSGEIMDATKPLIRKHIGPTLCGDKVIAFDEYWQDLVRQFPSIVGVEMEAAGSALGCLRFDPSPGIFMVRGVSDLANQSKGAPDVVSWRPYACDAAAAFATSLLRATPPLFQTRFP